jgi:hypothetical protein
VRTVCRQDIWNGFNKASCTQKKFQMRNWNKQKEWATYIQTDQPVKSHVVNLRMPSKWHIFKEGKAGTKKDNAAARLCFLKYLAFLWPVVNRAFSILPWVVSRGRLHGFSWANSRIQFFLRKDDPIPAYSPVSDRMLLTAAGWQNEGSSAKP